MTHLYYIRQCLGAPEFRDRMVYRYYLGANSTGVSYDIRKFKHQVRFFTTKPKALSVIANLKGKEWEVAIYKPRITPGLSKLSKPYTTTCRKYLGVSTMVCEILRAEGKKVLAEVVKREILAAVARRKQQYEKQRAALLKEIENGRPN